MHLPCSSTGGTAACTLASSSFASPLCTLLLHFIRHSVMRRSYKPLSSSNTARGGMQAVPLFCKISVSPLDTAASLVTSSFCPSIPSLVYHRLWLRNQIVGRAFPSTPFLCSTRSHWSSLFIGDVVPSSALVQVPTCFLTETVRQVEATDRHNRRGGITRT